MASADQNDMALALMLGMAPLTATMHDWLKGEYNYYCAQGYTHEQSCAMSAALFVTCFGAKIPEPPKES